MRRVLFVMLAIFATLSTVSAQYVLSKADKAMVAKEVKRLKKDGWKAAEGDKTLEQQMTEYYQKNLTLDENGNPTYLIVQGVGTSKSYDVAKTKALTFCRQEIALHFSDVSVEIKSDGTTTTSFKPSATRKPGRQQQIICLYRKKDGNIEVRVAVATEAPKI